MTEISKKLRENGHQIDAALAGQDGFLIVDWRDEGTGIDRIPVGWLQKGERVGRTHAVVVNSKIYIAKCDVTSNGRVATFDYAKHRKFNRRHEIELGYMRISIPTQGLDHCTIEWKDEGGRFRPDAHAGTWHCPHNIDEEEVGHRATIEGKRSLRSHLVAERDGSLAKLKLQEAQAKGRLECEVCEINFEEAFPELDTHAYEVHHRHPMSKGPRKTRLKDLSVLCRNCHGLIHKTDPIRTVEELQRLCRKSLRG